YLKNFKFTGSVYSVREGDVVFPTRPVLTVEAPLPEAQIIETLLLNILNYQTLIATKASRIRLVAGDRTLIDFGMRRAHSIAAYHASRAAVIGGFDATSNVKAAKDFSIPVSGTMAHAFVQSFDSELEAFRQFAQVWPANCVLLVDTYDTLKSGVPHAIKIAEEMEASGERLKGIRLDSGDLAYLAKKSRQMLDDAGFNYVKIAASNQLDEYVIKSLVDQGAPIDLFGVGTSLVIGRPDAALDGVYKLAFADGKPRIKLSESTAKITLPHKKQVYRLYNNQDEPIGADLVAISADDELDEMHHPFDVHKKMNVANCKREALLQQVMEGGKRKVPAQPVGEIAKYAKQRIDSLPEEYKRFDNPHIYKVGLSKGLNDARNQLIQKFKKGR
ncbi:MAG TPA: nicotinate phosphoribosyltransferase, partial [Cryomorphaceae bacterium]|nr:nicotinate phosphoribosyltransferase [Cryomorphaceae bacterium]